MKTNFLKVLAILFTFAIVGLTSCNKDDNDNNLTGKSFTYNLNQINNSGISGKIKFEELTDGRIQINLDLDGTKNGDTHPAHVHAKSASLGGDILIPLESVAGATGSSITVITKDVNGKTLSIADIDNLDAYVNVHKSSSELGVIISQGDIGSNVFTGVSKEYTLKTKDIAAITGKVKFQERKNGFALATIELQGTTAGGVHPAHIHMNSAVESGGILLTFNSVDGTTGKSVTEIRTNAAGEKYDYKNIISTNGYVNVHLSAADLGTIVAQGDIGLNELTGEVTSYALSTKDVPGISGNVKFEERKDGSVLATIALTGTPNTGSHPAHIHKNSAAEGGPIAITFNSVNGATGKSLTSIRNQDDGTNFNYQLLKSYNGYVNVHLSVAELNVIVAQGNIGIN